MGIRRHLTYANVTATLALVFALGAGGAYAVDQIGSNDIRNNSIRSGDLRNREAVAGRDVMPDALGHREVDEADLVAGQVLDVAGETGPTCEVEPSEFSDCVETNVRLRRRGRILATATGAFFGDGSEKSNARCELRLDGNSNSSGVSPGQLGDSTDNTATQGFARTAVLGPVSGGRHAVALSCTELLGDATIASPTITAIAITGR